ncbi:MAG: hypothetical protein Q8916_08620 [Bacteroidota bacterium]|nr:hypothetical protein [Bacteroidota bacterium]
MCERTIVIALVLFCTFSSLYAQAEDPADSSDVFAYHQNIFLKFLFPKGIAEGVALRSYIRSSAWDEFRKENSDLESFDELFIDADALCSDDRTAAILACSIATLDHKTIPLKLLFGATLSIPLTLESEDDFEARVSKLPKYLYDPNIPDGDKCQHFFFSAFFMRIVKMNWLVRLFGNGVEIGEQLFVVGGANDVRDRHANADGRNFGASCEEDSLPLPSMFLTPNPK